MLRVAFVVGDYPPAEKKLREDVAKSYSNAEVEVGIIPQSRRPSAGLDRPKSSWSRPITTTPSSARNRKAMTL